MEVRRAEESSGGGRFAGGNPLDAVVAAARAAFTRSAFPIPTKIEETIEEERPSVILLDVVMPQRNGFQACRDLKSHGVLLADSGDSRDVKDGAERSLLGRAAGRQRLRREAVHAGGIDQRGEKVCLMAGKTKSAGKRRAATRARRAESFSRAKRFLRNGCPSGSTAFFAPAASDFVFRCLKSRK